MKNYDGKELNQISTAIIILMALLCLLIWTLS
jgi:hypothetical protein